MSTRPDRHLPPLDPRQRYTPEEAAAYLRMSRKRVFDDIREGRLNSLKEGKRRYIPGTEIARRSSASEQLTAC
jgi:excisionase family DNA binding protein